MGLFGVSSKYTMVIADKRLLSLFIGLHLSQTKALVICATRGQKRCPVSVISWAGYRLEMGGCTNIRRAISLSRKSNCDHC